MKEKEVKKSLRRGKFSETFKRAVIEDYLLTGDTKERVQLRHGIKGNSVLQKWMKLLGYVDVFQKEVNLGQTIDPTLARQQNTKNAETIRLEVKIKELERQLEDERLRSEMLNRMVDLAEKTYKIPVRKNFNTK